MITPQVWQQESRQPPASGEGSEPTITGAVAILQPESVAAVMKMVKLNWFAPQDSITLKLAL